MVASREYPCTTTVLDGTSPRAKTNLICMKMNLERKLIFIWMVNLRTGSRLGKERRLSTKPRFNTEAKDNKTTLQRVVLFTISQRIFGKSSKTSLLVCLYNNQDNTWLLEDIGCSLYFNPGFPACFDPLFLYHVPPVGLWSSSAGHFFHGLYNVPTFLQCSSWCFLGVLVIRSPSPITRSVQLPY